MVIFFDNLKTCSYVKKDPKIQIWHYVFTFKVIKSPKKECKPKILNFWVSNDTQKLNFLKMCLFSDLLLYTIWKVRLRALEWCQLCLWDFFWPKQRNHLYVIAKIQTGLIEPILTMCEFHLFLNENHASLITFHAGLSWYRRFSPTAGSMLYSGRFGWLQTRLKAVYVVNRLSLSQPTDWLWSISCY